MTAAISPTVTPANLISTYAKRGVRIWINADRLEVAAPAGELKQDDLATLKELKPGLLAFLDGQPHDPDERTNGPGGGQADGSPGEPWSPRLLPWRDTLAKWPNDAREKWGRLVERIENEGADWYDAERLAFEELGGRVAVAKGVAREAWDEPVARDEVPAWVFDDSLVFDPFKAKEAVEREARMRELAGKNRAEVAGETAGPPSLEHSSPPFLGQPSATEGQTTSEMKSERRPAKAAKKEDTPGLFG